MSHGHRASLHRASLGALAVLSLLAGGCGRRTDAPPVEAARADFDVTPILWAKSDVPYRDFRPVPLTALHAEVESVLGEPLLFRVVPFVEEKGEPPEPVLVGETLEIYYQESKASANVLRRHADRVARLVRSAFPGLDENDHLLIHARLPEGKLIADIDRKLHDACAARNAVRTDILPAVYVPGTLEELNFVLCDGPATLDARLQDPDWPLIEENWRTEDQLR